MLIIRTLTLIVSDITKPLSKNCFIIQCNCFIIQNEIMTKAPSHGTQFEIDLGVIHCKQPSAKLIIW